VEVATIAVRVGERDERIGEACTLVCGQVRRRGVVERANLRLEFADGAGVGV